MWSSLKQLIRANNDKCVIVEDGEPKYVILTYKEYQHLQKDDKNSIVEENPQASLTAEDINAEAQEMQEFQADNSLRIEDLPF